MAIKPDYSFDQIKTELIERHNIKPETLENGITGNLYSKAKRSLKGRGVDPFMCPFAYLLENSRSPWGRIDGAEKLTDGLFMVHTPSHGGLWIGDQWLRKLPKSYKPFTGNRRWAEEDEDAAIVLQHFGLLSLISEPLTLEVTEPDIVKGRASRLTFYGNPYFESRMDNSTLGNTAYRGGAIVEAYQRQTGDHCGEMNCTTGKYSTLSPRPGGWRICQLPEDANHYMQAFDRGEDVKPAHFTLEPYIYVPISERESVA